MKNKNNQSIFGWLMSLIGGVILSLSFAALVFADLLLTEADIKNFWLAVLGVNL